MRMFSSLRVYVFFGVVFLLVVGTVYAQKDSLEVAIDRPEAAYDIGESETVTFYVIPDDVETDLIITWVGVEVTRMVGEDSPIPGPYVSGSIYTTSDIGILIIECKIISSGAYVQAEWKEKNRTARVNFGVEGPFISPSATIVVNPPVPKSPLRVGDTFTQTIEVQDVKDLASWQMDVAFNPEVLELVEIVEGDFLGQDGRDTFFQGEYTTDEVTVRQVRIDRSGVPLSGASGSGVLVVLTFRFALSSEALLGLHNVRLSDPSGERLSYSVSLTPVVATHASSAAEDINQDGMVNIQDLVVVARSIGSTHPNLRTDVNDDGIVDVLDLVAVVGSPHWGWVVSIIKVREPNAAAPVASVSGLTPATIRTWINLAQVEDDGSVIFDRGIANLEVLLASRIPRETKLLPNYPNPFNPETWMPYQLSEAADVTVSIYSVNGALVRALALGHQAAGTYQSKSRAAYWDGRNDFGERVASGLYFYTLTTGDFTATRKMLIRK